MPQPRNRSIAGVLSGSRRWGHGIPLDPQFRSWRARELRVATRFIDLAEDVNLHMPEYVATRILDLLSARSLPAFSTPVLDAHVPADRLERFGSEVVRDVTNLGAWEVAVVLTDHRDVDYRALAESVALVFDRRGVYRRLGIQAGNVITL